MFGLATALAVFVFVVLVVAALAAVARVRGWDPTWAAASRHACEEAAYRTSSLWSEFRDWLRSA